MRWLAVIVLCAFAEVALATHLGIAECKDIDCTGENGTAVQNVAKRAAMREKIKDWYNTQCLIASCPKRRRVTVTVRTEMPWPCLIEYDVYEVTFSVPWTNWHYRSLGDPAYQDCSGDRR